MSGYLGQFELLLCVDAVGICTSSLALGGGWSASTPSVIRADILPMAIAEPRVAGPVQSKK
jgi:hypothetical protein